MGIVFDFRELKGRIIARYGNCGNFAKAINMSRSQISDRLNNKIQFRPEEIYIICAPDVLDIPEAEIGRYFLTPKV